MNIAMAVQSHPDQFLLGDYVAGSLPAAVALLVAVHLEYCASCRVECSDLTRMGAQLFAGLDALPLAEDALPRLLSRLDEAPLGVSARPSTNPEASELPRALRTLVPQGIQSLDWKRVNASLRVARLRFGDDSREVALHHIAAGGRVPEHDHVGNETMVVLHGRFADDDGVHAEGDFLQRGPGDVHRPMGAQDTDCICLAVMDAPIRLTGLLGRVINPFLRIRPG